MRGESLILRRREGPPSPPFLRSHSCGGAVRTLLGPQAVVSAATGRPRPADPDTRSVSTSVTVPACVQPSPRRWQSEGAGSWGWVPAPRSGAEGPPGAGPGVVFYSSPGLGAY